MNEISAKSNVESNDALSNSNVGARNASRGQITSNETISRKKVNKLDSEFGLNEHEEQKQVLVSPKSSMLSARVNEPETADEWARKMIEFSTTYASYIEQTKVMSNVQVAKRAVYQKLNKMATFENSILNRAFSLTGSPTAATPAPRIPMNRRGTIIEKKDMTIAIKEMQSKLETEQKLAEIKLMLQD